MVLASVLDWHLERYPLLRAADVYKLVHQGVFGPGHIVRSPDQARRALVAELAGLRDCGPAGTRVEPLDPDRRLVRVNLAPLRGRPDAADRLVPALVATAAETRSDPALMAARFAEALAWCRERLPAESEALAGLAGDPGWPARHHSRVYAAAYRPAYRVVSAARWPADCGRPHPSSGTSG